jgi:hypothetical protein
VFSGQEDEVRRDRKERRLEEGNGAMDESTNTQGAAVYMSLDIRLREDGFELSSSTRWREGFGIGSASICLVNLQYMHDLCEVLSLMTPSIALPSSSKLWQLCTEASNQTQLPSQGPSSSLPFRAV